MCRKVGMQSCKELREARCRPAGTTYDKGLSVADLTTLDALGTLGSVLPELVVLTILETGVSMAYSVFHLFRRRASAGGSHPCQRRDEG